MLCCALWQVIVAERGPLVFVFNFSPFNDYEGYKARPRWRRPEPGQCKRALCDVAMAQLTKAAHAH